MRLSGVFKPEYLLRPANIVRRVKYRDTSQLPAVFSISVRGRPFQLDPNEVIGRHLLHFGLFDLLVSEALLRLAERGEVAADVGANVGYMSVLLAEAVGPGGQVYSFEPHPEIFKDLERNVAGLPVKPVQAAVSESEGVAVLHLPPAFSENRGLASLEPSVEGESIEVGSMPLDSLFPASQSVAVLKLDVEGHELAVLRGARCLLEEKRVRDIVFEDHDPARSPVAEFLAERGYSVFLLKKGFFGPQLADRTTPGDLSTWESPSLLATTDPQRAQALLRPKGWRILAPPARA